MQQYFESLSIIVLSLAAFILVFMIILNLYLIKRNGFYITVNCWFCNSFTKVLYQDRNSFNCPTCSQYNGFKEDGSYNKVIEAQHNISFTKFTQKTEFSENGLCTYCNNNQQLKIYQLAKFTPINEMNYDIEVEHFRKQLEKAYKLCKKCEQVLKSKLKTQHSWIFGNRLKDLRKKGYSILNKTKVPKIVKDSKFLKCIRFILIFATIMILCHLLDIRIVYPEPKINIHTPEVFKLYKTILYDYQHRILHIVKRFGNNYGHINKYFQMNITFKNSDITSVTCISFLLDLVLSIGENKSLLWKINRSFGWIILLVTSSVSFSNIFTSHIFGLQILATLALLYMYIWSPSMVQSKSSLKEYSFKKLPNLTEATESSEEETDEDIPNHLNDTSKTFLKSHRTSSPLGQNSNKRFTTAKSITSTSEYNSTDNSSDLNRSLDNLHLSFNSQRCTSPIFSVNTSKRPILSPSKLKNITQNPWTAGGFWKNDTNVFSASVNGTNLSRSSSQTSGFVSNHNQNINSPFNSLPVSREPSLGGDVERASLLSEPAYHFSPISSNANLFNVSKSTQLYYKTDNNTFYPVLGENSMLFIQNGIPQKRFSNNFGNVNTCQPLNIFGDSRSNCSVKNFDNKTLGGFASSVVGSVSSPSLFNEKPVSALFKNLQMSDNFKRPQFQ